MTNAALRATNLLATTLLATTLFATGARAQHAETCEAIPKDEWRPQAELERKLGDQGWKISRVKITNGCYEVYGKNAQGRNVELFFHPKTFELVTAAK